MQKMQTGKKKPFSTNGSGKMYVQMQKNDIRSVSITLYKILFEKDHRPKCEA